MGSVLFTTPFRGVVDGIGASISQPKPVAVGQVTKLWPTG
jgi:hypothetical protein